MSDGPGRWGPPPGGPYPRARKPPAHAGHTTGRRYCREPDDAGGVMARRRRKGSIGERFRAGDEAALAEVFDEYAGPMLAVASSMLSDRRLAEEAVQQAFVQAWRAASSFEPERPLGPWLRAIGGRAAGD